MKRNYITGPTGHPEGQGQVKRYHLSASKTRMNDYTTWKFGVGSKVLYDGAKSGYLRYVPFCLPVMINSCIAYYFICRTKEKIKKQKLELKEKREVMDKLNERFQAGYDRGIKECEWKTGFPLSTLEKYKDMIKVMEHDRKAREDRETMDKLRESVRQVHGQRLPPDY